MPSLLLFLYDGLQNEVLPPGHEIMRRLIRRFAVVVDERETISSLR